MADEISIGDRFMRLVVIDGPVYKESSSGRNEKWWTCRCDCGVNKDVRDACLRNGTNRSCGCYRDEENRKRFVTHGMSGTKLSHVFRSMKCRCYNPNTQGYKNYGGKGVYICDDWLNDPAAFYELALANGYEEGKTIDRINPDGPYSPENCRWVSWQTQNNHTSRNHMITFNGKTQSMADWSRETGIPYSAIKTRINKRGWPVERALTEPVH